MPSAIRQAPGPRYRTVAEAGIVGLLRLHGGCGDTVAQAALDRLVDAGLPFARGADGRCFDPGEALNLVKSLGLQGRDGFWTRHCVPAGRHRTAAMPAGPQRVSVLLRRTFGLAGVRPGRRIRLRLPLPIEDAHVQHLSVDLVSMDAAPLHVQRTPARLEVLLAAPDQAALTIAVRLAFTSVADAVLRDLPDPASHLRPHDGFVQVTPRIAALAATLAGGPAERTVQAFADLMLDRLTCGTIQYAGLAPGTAVDGVLDHGWFDCHLGSALLAALCRAAGIPARPVAGLLLYPGAPTPHHWAEIWLGDAWRPFDLLAWDLSEGGRDPAWRTCFRGQVDHRMRTGRLPLLFTGASSPVLPDARHLLMAPTADGIAVSHVAAPTGALLYRDDIAVTLAPAG